MVKYMEMFTILCKPTDQLTPAESRQVDEVSNLAFAKEVGPGAAFDQWANTEIHLLGLLDQQIVSLLGLTTRQVNVGGQLIFVAGVGGVATHPAFQRRGYAGLLMRRARQYIQDEIKAPFGLLVCSPHREHLYRSLGWLTVNEPVLVSTSAGKHPWPEKVMILPLTSQAWPAGFVDLCGAPW